MEGSPDLEAAHLMARLLGTIHHEHLLSAEEVAAHLPRILYLLESFDQDLVLSAVPTYFTARLAAELFAGYRYHRDVDGDEGMRRELLCEAFADPGNGDGHRSDGAAQPRRPTRERNLTRRR